MRYVFILCSLSFLWHYTHYGVHSGSVSAENSGLEWTLRLTLVTFCSSINHVEVICIEGDRADRVLVAFGRLYDRAGPAFEIIQVLGQNRILGNDR